MDTVTLVILLLFGLVFIAAIGSGVGLWLRFRGRRDLELQRQQQATDPED